MTTIAGNLPETVITITILPAPLLALSISDTALAITTEIFTPNSVNIEERE